MLKILMAYRSLYLEMIHVKYALVCQSLPIGIVGNVFLVGKKAHSCSLAAGLRPLQVN